MIPILLLIFSSVVILEFGIHTIYHAVTGKAGLDDPAFSYLKDIWSVLNEKLRNSFSRRVEQKNR